MPFSCAKLWIVATPLGNPGDFSPRARDVLSSVDLVLAEDTRRAEQLLRACRVRVKKLVSFFEHNEEMRHRSVLAALRGGAQVALLSDAGTPLVADPGYRLVRACRKAGIAVSPLPGPCAPIAALSAAGLPPLPFSFLGFLPRGEKSRRDIFAAYARAPGSIVFFERKDRIEASLQIALSVLGPRELAICRELTKPYEEFIIGRLEDYRIFCDGLLGEITVIVGPPESKDRTERQMVMDLLEKEFASGSRGRRAARAVQAQCSGWTTKEIYELAISFVDAGVEI